MFHNFFILFSSVSPSTACCLFSLDTTCPNNHISFIHHMLLFICNAPTLRCKSQDFNTSHVTLYQEHPRRSYYTTNVSIHLMLLFIKLLDTQRFALVRFQYISCYSLSFQRDHLHFQIQRFQYISCYSLSKKKRDLRCIWRCFNTSHVTLYLYSSPNNVGSSGVSIHLMLLFIAIRHWKEQHLLGFNTSHVTLYP